jgi:hypothetical protein
MAELQQSTNWTELIQLSHIASELYHRERRLQHLFCCCVMSQRTWRMPQYEEETVNTKFLGLQIDNYLNWKPHIDQLVPKLSEACYAVRSVLHISTTDTLSSIYFVYLHSLMKYGIIFWGNLCDSKKVFTFQKKTVRIMMGVKSHNYCRELFKRLEILTLPCEYVFSLKTSLHIMNIFRPMQMYTVLTQDTSTIFINQLLTSHAFRKVHICWDQHFQ